MFSCLLSGISLQATTRLLRLFVGGEPEFHIGLIDRESLLRFENYSETVVTVVYRSKDVSFVKSSVFIRFDHILLATPRPLVTLIQKKRHEFFTPLSRM